MTEVMVKNYEHFYDVSETPLQIAIGPVCPHFISEINEQILMKIRYWRSTLNAVTQWEFLGLLYSNTSM
jgi:hypothetical protein